MASQDPCRIMSVADIITHIGEFGRYQKIVEGIISFVCFFVSLQTFLMYFTTLNSSWRCSSNSSTCQRNETRKSDDMTRCNLPRDQWYFTEQKSFSMVTWYDIPCEKQWMIGAISSIYFVGFAVGAIVLGWLADVFGRKLVLIPSVSMHLSLGALCVAMPNAYCVIVLRFCAGFFHPGAMVQGVILMAEIVGTSKRSVAMLIPFAFFPIGWAVVAAKAYLFQDWRILCIVCTVPYFIIFLCLFSFIPESPAWLVEKGRTSEAEEILRRMAKWNKVDLPFDVSLSAVKEFEASADIPFNSKKDLTISTLVQCAIWCSTTLAFFGLNFAADKLPGNLYLNFILLSVIELPTIGLAMVFCNRFGRKKTTLLPIFLSGAICVILKFFPMNRSLDFVKTLTGILGKFFACIPFQSLYLWTSELYPTRYRAQGLGLMDCVSRLSAACAPFLVNRNNISSWLFFIFGIPAVVTSIVGLWLPETKAEESSTKISSQMMEDFDSMSTKKIQLLIYKYYQRVQRSARENNSK